MPVGQQLEYRINFENLRRRPFGAACPYHGLAAASAGPKNRAAEGDRVQAVQIYFACEPKLLSEPCPELAKTLGISKQTFSPVLIWSIIEFLNLQAIDPNTGETPLDPFAGDLAAQQREQGRRGLCDLYGRSQIILRQSDDDY